MVFKSTHSFIGRGPYLSILLARLKIIMANALLCKRQRPFCT